MNEDDKLLNSTLSTSPLLFRAVNETETVGERKQTHSQSQAKGVKGVHRGTASKPGTPDGEGSEMTKDEPC